MLARQTFSWLSHLFSPFSLLLLKQYILLCFMVSKVGESQGSQTLIMRDSIGQTQHKSSKKPVKAQGTDNLDCCHLENCLNRLKEIWVDIACTYDFFLNKKDSERGRDKGIRSSRPSWVQDELKGSLGNMKPCLKTSKPTPIKFFFKVEKKTLGI